MIRVELKTKILKECSETGECKLTNSEISELFSKTPEYLDFLHDNNLWGKAQVTPFDYLIVTDEELNK